MLSIEALKELLTTLTNAPHPDQLTWKIVGNGISIVLPDVILSLRQSPDEQSIAVEAELPNREVIYRSTVGITDELYSLCNRLLEIGQKYGSEQLIQAVAQSVLSIRGAADVRVTVENLPPSPPAPPPEPTQEEERQFFDMIKGQWFLDFTRGTEELSIDESGAYYVRPRVSRNAIAIKFPPEPRFRLKLLSWDKAEKKAELAKMELDERVRQIEALTIAEDTMEGYVKHDGRRLRYKKIRG